MGITYVGGQVGSRAGATSTLSTNFSLSGGTNSTPQAGDLVIITITVGSVARNPACAVVTPTGYTALGLLNDSVDTQDTSLDVSYKFMGPIPDTAFTRPSTGNVQDAQAYTVQVFRGVSVVPLDVAAVSAIGNNTDRPNPASITPTTTGAYVVICGGGGSLTGANYTAPANYTTNFLTQTQADTNDVTIGSGYRAWTSGAEDPAAYTGGENAATDSWCAYTIALRPAFAFGDIDADEDITSGSSFTQTVSTIAKRAGIATVLLAASLGQALATGDQSEVPQSPVANGTTGGIPQDLWPAAGNPRISYLYANDDLAAQVTSNPLDDSVEIILFSVRSKVVLPDAYATDELGSVISSIITEDNNWSAPIIPKSVRSSIVYETQDELVAQPVIDNYGDTGGFSPDLWSASANKPNIINLYSDDVIVAQPTPINIDESDWNPPFTIPPIRSLYIEQYQDERVAPVATIAIDDSDGVLYYSTNGKVWMPVPWQFGSSEGSVWSPIAEDYYYDPGTRRVILPSILSSIDEVIVSQPSSVIDEVYWNFTDRITRRLVIDVSNTNEEITSPISIDAGEWFPPFNVRQTVNTTVYNTQDERVNQPAPLGIDEVYWEYYWVALAKRTVVNVLPATLVDHSDYLVEFVSPPIPPVIPPTPPGHGKYRLIPSMDVVDRARFPQDNIGTPNV